MNNYRVLLTIAGVAILLAAPERSFSQDDGGGFFKAVSDDVSIRVGGTLQSRVTFASDLNQVGVRHERIGFGIRRMRLRLSTNIGERLGLFLQMDGSGTFTTWLDLRGEYRVDEHLTIRAGRFVGAQPRAFARTFHSDVDAIDRPAISERWAKMTIGSDGRDYGVEALWVSPGWEIRGFLHNGYNRLNLSSGISRTVAEGGVTDGIETEGFAFSAALTHWPDGRDRFEIGAYASVNTTKNELTEIGRVGRNYISYSAHAYWGPLAGDQPLRLKTNIIGISYQKVDPWDVENFIGASLFGGYLVVPHIEMFATGEYWHGDGGGLNGINQVFATLGGSYSLSALRDKPFVQNRLILAYSIRSMESKSVNFDELTHLLMMQMQLYF